MQAGDYKALLSALLLPPAGPLLLALLGLVFCIAWRRLGLALVAFGLAALWALSTHGIALQLSRHLVPPPPPAGLADLARHRTQAIVVLGGGVLAQAPEYGEPQPSAATLGRLRQGARLARATGLPLAFAGGMGWSGRSLASEAEAARMAARRDFGVELRWVDDRSRDTRENAQRLAELLRPRAAGGVRRIALVSDAWHLPRATIELRAAGFEVLPAPTGLPFPQERPALEWLPTAYGLSASRQVLREWLALQYLRLSPP
ncbi:YdcF family protein [Ramlibacter sp. MAHUQ-53]|uniref:YdcF family protein n=1 Tax=unclassified Ramlibacter TaxID=2617605 RepID=UPI0036279347